MALTRIPGFIVDSTSTFTFAEATVTGNVIARNISGNGNVNFSNSSNVSLGSVANLKITGGTANYVLSTDGTGNLSWVNATQSQATLDGVVDEFTGTGEQSAFTLSVTPASKNVTFAVVQGLIQPKSVYSVTGNVLTFSSPPPANAIVEITTMRIV